MAKNDRIIEKREKDVAGFIKNILKLSVIALAVPAIAFGAQQQNPRGSVAAKTTARSADAVSNASIRRSATSVIARSTAENNRKSRAVVTARPATVRTASVRSVRSVLPGNGVARSASKSSVVRSGMKQKSGKANLSRAGVARATAVFNDITKIGGGYANCRDAYATCMDQLCANANDTYRRCFCSDRFTEFRETSDNLDTALKMLAEFQNNNLDAVDKTAAEVNAMYTATAGEKAIKTDVSASQQLLNSIGDILSGKKSAVKQQKTTTSLGVLDFSGFSSNNDDIFGSSSSLFGGDSSYTDVSTLEGKELYDNAMKQCSEITREACGGDAMFNLARSAYSIMITQDCNAYEKNINAKKASVEETVRTAEKYLREARLDEYRSHNSADVNECLTKVDEAMRQPLACGPNYEKCMDYTGQYINPNTGEPIYSQALFGLNNLIVLNGSADVLKANPKFDKWLEDRKMFAETALDSCRDNAGIVWEEFKRSAIIQIAQAQDDKIQQIKDTCVATVKECYDTQTGALKSMDTTELQGTGAIATATARGMCYDRVQACAALYGDPDGCVYIDASKKLTSADGKKCGLQSLLTFVDTVDSVKVAEGCESVLTKYAHELCPDDVKYKLDEKGNKVTDEDGEYIVEETIPYGKCVSDDATRMSKAKIRAAMDNRMKVFCPSDLINGDTSNTIGTSAFNTNIMNTIVKDIYDALGIAFTAGCEDLGGAWVSSEESAAPAVDMLIQEFYTKYYGRKVTKAGDYIEMNSQDMGWCISADRQNQCLDLGEEYQTGLDDNGSCKLTDFWFMDMCTNLLNGQWEGGNCVVDNITNDNAPAGISSIVPQTKKFDVLFEPIKDLKQKKSEEARQKQLEEQRKMEEELRKKQAAMNDIVKELVSTVQSGGITAKNMESVFNKLMLDCYKNGIKPEELIDSLPQDLPMRNMLVPAAKEYIRTHL